MGIRIHIFVAVVSLTTISSAPLRGEPPTAEQKKGTVDYLLSLQRDKGGFAESKKENAPATLPATFAAVYALRSFGGDLKEKKTCGDFVLGCRKKDQRHYAPTPGGEPDVRATTLAAFTLVELRRIRALEGEVPTLSAVVSSLSLADEAKTLEDYRLLGAGYETMSKQVRVNFNDKDQVIKKVKDMANPDGTFGKGDSAFRDSAAAVVAVRGLRGDIDKAEQLVKLLKSAQRPDGGWGKDKSELETTALLVHALALLKGECDATACQKFVAKCRNEDGSYGPQPGQPGSVHATYQAGAVLERLGQLTARGK